MRWRMAILAVVVLLTTQARATQFVYIDPAAAKYPAAGAAERVDNPLGPGAPETWVRYAPGETSEAYFPAVFLPGCAETGTPFQVTALFHFGGASSDTGCFRVTLGTHTIGDGPSVYHYGSPAIFEASGLGTTSSQAFVLTGLGPGVLQSGIPLKIRVERVEGFGITCTNTSGFPLFIEQVYLSCD